ncbi:probable F-box protein At5g04010 [Ricinus communis]|uniref:F-box protein n=1 Tax=Ricinus communis TaxID=3988 RepID=B9SVS5_RICCO|nr:probable F-box protein At5g04010 [Ricinus communis]EEF32293.1 conserved hypothetical protein [Ricinus communis]|eukprot:XP_002530094.1 probable F-box protein At5g04010 [Ricinus communis]
MPLNMAKLRSYKPTASDAPPPPPQPPWEVVALVAHHLDPKILAIASCVSKSWYISTSSDHIWRPFCTAHYPSVSQLRLNNPLIPYNRLYAMAYTATKRRVKSPSKPQVSLDKLIFVINISAKKKSHSIINTAKPGSELDQHMYRGVFRFDIDANYYLHEAIEDVRISWHVVMEGWREVFTMMDVEGKVGFSRGGEGWFSAELPCPGCCLSDTMSSGVVADLKLRFSGDHGESESDGKVKVDKVSVGILSIVNWRYVSLENGLRYLQHFLVP